MPSVLIGAGPLRNHSGPFRDCLVAAGFDTIDPAGDHTLTFAELRPALPQCAAIVAGGEHLGPEQMDLAPGLRVIARTGVGYDSVDIVAATARKIVVTITPGTNHGSVAEQAFGLLLGVTRRIAYNDRMIRLGLWDRTLVSPIRGKTLGLLGFGRIARAMVARARAFEMRVIATDPQVDPRLAASMEVPLVGLDELVSSSDVLSLHCPATPETRHLVNRELLARMPAGSILINTARGSIVDESALLDAVKSGHLAGAGLDVLEVEPAIAEHPFFAVDQIVMSPHLGGIDTLSMAAMAELAARNIVDLYQGRWPAECVVNSSLAIAWRW
jgi:D-3-phosphoglycerate dehydrogenase / 2-oxoglutarate reductase